MLSSCFPICFLGILSIFLVYLFLFSLFRCFSALLLLIYNIFLHLIKTKKTKNVLFITQVSVIPYSCQVFVVPRVVQHKSRLTI
jgi:hypothetical protein